MSNIIPIAYAALDSNQFGRVVDPIIANIVNPLLILLFAVAVVVFVYGVLQMVIHGDDADARAKGKWSIFGGIIGMFIMLSAWGIIYLVSNTIKSI